VQPSPDGPGRRPGFGRGILVAGGVYLVAGLVILAATIHAALTGPRDDYPGLDTAARFSVLLLITPVVLLVLGIVLTIRRKESGFGTGLLVGCLLGVLLAPILTAGACVGLLDVAG
jgi:CHASE2 domain-containing sensor protein